MANAPKTSPFYEYVLKLGKIPFLVRGTLECRGRFTFEDFGIIVSEPTAQLQVFAEDTERIGPFYVRELHQEVVFPGEVELLERSVAGVDEALTRLEVWADFICLIVGGCRLTVEIKEPIQAVVTGQNQTLEYRILEDGLDMFEAFLKLDLDARRVIARAQWWYRKGCNTFPTSIFDSYTAFWNALEILCEVAPNKTKDGEIENIHSYLMKHIEIIDGQAHLRIKPGHIQECYNKYVNKSIKFQMERQLKEMLPPPMADEYVHHCFYMKPNELQLYAIRNDINHGNIQENSPKARRIVHPRGMLLQEMVFRLLCRKLGKHISLGSQSNLDELWSVLQQPFQ